ncbi:MAG: M28 family peptidase [Planctomycetales bacterium]|nr:M28 family peptidase [Planctomycetales bacterium]
MSYPLIKNPRRSVLRILLVTVLFTAPLAPRPVCAEVTSSETPTQRFDGQRAYEYLKQLCQLGNRMSGSPGMLQQQQLLEKHFAQLGAAVGFQQFQIRQHPLTGQPVPMANLVIQWHPESAERILLCAHYDTRPYPDREADPRRAREGVFLGANDGASGVAVLMELGHHVRDLPTHYGLDFVLFDAEEFVFEERSDRYFLGSEWFARQYRDDPPSHRYIAGVLLDMVGDARLSIYQERHSATWSDTRPLVKEIWSTAKELGVKEFIPRIGYPTAIRDDHLPLHNIAKIPVIDIIDFEYPDRSNRYWHTTADAPGRCSADSLGKVGLVMQTWLASKR